MTCMCRAFDIDKLPCVHAITAAHHAHVGVYTLASRYYMKYFYMLAYEDTIYPMLSQSQWNVSDEVFDKVVLSCIVKDKKRGRPKTSRYPSAGELRKHKNRCKWCGELGHNQKSCRSETGCNDHNTPNETPG